jgi:hypothetical protein
VIEAAPVIATFAERLSCLSQPSGAKSLNEFAAPNTTFEWGYLNYPMFNTRYHDKAYCMTVLRIHGWEALANNALKYEVQFKAEDSGEVHSNSHVIVKQSDGTWLFKQ